MKHITIAQNFDDPAYLSAFWRNDPAHGKIVTKADGSILYLDNRYERIISADLWHVSRETLAAFAAEQGDQYSYISPGSFAYSLFRQRFAPPYQWHMGGTPGEYRSQLTSAAIIGGRCELYAACHDVPLYQLDIRSAYPYAATILRFPDPLSYHRSDPLVRNIWRYEGVSAGIVSQEGAIPYLPYRVNLPGEKDPHVIYPIMERAYGIWSHVELRAALQNGAKIHLLDRQYIADRYLPGNPYSAFVNYCWEQRQTSAYADLWKTIVNALFGRLASGGGGLWQWTLHDFSGPGNYDTFSHMAYYGAACDRQAFNPPSPGNHLHAAMILAKARERLYSLLRLGPYYADTDCAMFPTMPVDLPIPVSEAWGDLSLTYGHYTIKGQKAYIVKKDGGGYRIVLRGVSRTGRNVEDFYAASGTNERLTRENDLVTIPHTVVGVSCTFPRQVD